MKIFKYNHSLDWLTMTFTARQYPETVLPLIDLFEPKEEVPGGKNYKNAYKLACGGLYGYSSEVRQGIMVMLPGQALGTLRQAGWSDEMTINWAMQAHNVTRLDFAMDIFGGTAKDHSPHDFYNEWKEKRLRTRMKLDRSITDYSKKTQGDTYYWGSAQSDQRVCVYNKGVEQKFFDYAWTRVETRWKDDYAKAVRNDMNDYGVSRAGMAKVKSVFDADIEGFQNMLEHDPMELSVVPRKPGNFPGWLEKSVKPAITNNLDQERDAIRLLYDWIGQQLSPVERINELTGYEK